jgi:plastocyanin
MIRRYSTEKPARPALAFAAIASIAAMLTQPASAETHRVDMKGVAFTPAQITVRVGDTLEWSNGDIAAHTATSKEGGFDVNVPPGRMGSTVVDQGGSLAYTCRYHPNMKVQIVVRP